MTRRSDPIKRVELADGRTRYRFVVDVGDEAGMVKRDQRTFTHDTLTRGSAPSGLASSTSRRRAPTSGRRRRPWRAWLSEWLATKERSVKPTTHRALR